MSRIRKVVLAALSVLVLPLATTQAGVFIGVGFGGPCYHHYYRPWYGPRVIVAAPPVVVAPAPAPVYVAPAPVYVQPAPAPVYAPPAAAAPAPAPAPAPAAGALPAAPVPVTGQGY